MKEFVMSKDSPIVSTPKGKLRGFRFDGVDHFYGIRYAKAKRFQMPEPVPAWEGVKDAGSYGMNCPVLSEPMPTGEVLIPHRFWPSSEHCQYLNLWTKSCEPSAKRPVLFWIHGGGYASGSGMEQICYDGFNLAKDDDVVVVTVNHRLNAFGYLDLSAFGGEVLELRKRGHGRPGGGPALGAGQHRLLWRRPGQRDHLRPVRRRRESHRAGANPRG